MQTRIQSIVINGIKNIEESIQLDFSNKSNALPIANIKAIYGPNGSGKTAIIEALKIYQEVTLSKSKLLDKAYQKELCEVINKKTNIFSIEINALESDNTKIKHILKLENRNKEIIVAYEEVSKYKQGSNLVVEFTIKQTNGRAIFDKNIGRELIVNHEVIKRSIVDLYDSYFRILYSKGKDIDSLPARDQKEFDFFILFYNLAASFYIVTENADDHEYMFQNAKLNNGFYQGNPENTVYSVYDDIIPSGKIEDYTLLMNQIEKFIKIFKRDLQKINIETIDIGNQQLKVEKYYQYSDYKVHMEFESAGIKKLTTLYAALRFGINGGISVIDEFDANINDVYLNKLIEYFSNEAKGQLIFTTHNTSPMETLKRKKHSIDFLTEEGHIVNWKLNGNYSPSKLYENGSIEGLPFNIEPFDFVGLFEDEDN